jgi:hypothetical protein
MVTEISKFLSDDGNEFNTKEETIDHENKIKFCEEFIHGITPLVNIRSEMIYQNRHKIKELIEKYP